MPRVESPRSRVAVEQASLADLPHLDPEHYTRLDAERVSAEWRGRIVPRAPQENIESLPLWGGAHQEALF